MIRLTVLTVIAISCGLLTSCAIFKGTDKSNHDAICAELKKQIIWSGANGAPKLWEGATGDQMQATKQRAQNETLLQSYKNQGCLDDEVNN